MTSYDGEGNKTAYTAVSTSMTTNSDGSRTGTVTVDTTTFDKDGNVTGNVTGNVKTTTVVTESDGKTETTVTTVTTESDGTQTVDESTTVEEDCTKTGCPDYADPDYMVVPITEADLARVGSRLNQVRTPGPDTGTVTDAPPCPPGDLPLIALINPDGVVDFAVGTQPSFNRTQPDYDPQLNELVGIGGTTPPTQGQDGTTRWP